MHHLRCLAPVLASCLHHLAASIPIQLCFATGTGWRLSAPACTFSAQPGPSA